MCFQKTVLRTSQICLVASNFFLFHLPRVCPPSGKAENRENVTNLPQYCFVRQETRSPSPLPAWVARSNQNCSASSWIPTLPVKQIPRFRAANLWTRE